MNKKSLKKICLTVLLGLQVTTSMHAVSFSECISIALAYVKDPYSVGELVPLSDAAGDYLTKFISSEHASGKYYLEVGAGYGAITEHIVSKLQLEDVLDVIEIDPVMCEKLQQRFAQYSNVHVHCCSILDWNVSYRYDAIVSTLPFNSFHVDFAQGVMKLYQSIASSTCIISYVEYDIVDKLLKYFYTKEGRRIHNQVQRYLKNLRSKYVIEENIIYKNIPPLKVYHLQF